MCPVPLSIYIHLTHSLNTVKGLTASYLAACGVIDPVQAHIIGFLMKPLQMR